ncbi:hypothetical protein FOA52_011082 [Chlamydomonas sp. UWO 241]|nr:hypothetical protein FOA52_011082 [Chlamydomonas sp. UWO 241]
MAPKKDASHASKVDEKTFGLKNKNKSKRVQEQIHQMAQSGQPSQKEIRARQMAGLVDPKAKKEREEAKAAALAEIFSVKQPKLAPGVDPKSVVCEFFRHGQCTKGTRCKYSHDLNVEKKGPKIDLFTDQRDIEEGMDDWDQETLERAIAEKHANEKQSNATTIICKHFLEAVETKCYGWFWKCPAGVECKYRHALPAGYVLKSEMKGLLDAERANRRDIAELIEEERAKVDAKTPINDDVFKAWHAKRVADKRRKLDEGAEERRRKGVLTGREIFMQEGFAAIDDASAAEVDEPREDRAEEERLIQEMLDKAGADARAARATQVANKAKRDAAEEAGEEYVEEADAGTSDAAGAGTSAASAGTSAAAPAAAAPDAALDRIGEDADELFDDDDDDDFDEAALEALEEGIKISRVVPPSRGAWANRVVMAGCLKTNADASHRQTSAPEACRAYKGS